MEPGHDSFQPELRKFLASIPEFSSTSMDSTLSIDGEKSRARWTAVITEEIQKRFANPEKSGTEWLYELAEFNHTDQDDSSFIALLLVDYIAESPWVALEEDVKRMDEYRSDTSVRKAFFCHLDDSKISKLGILFEYIIQLLADLNIRISL